MTEPWEFTDGDPEPALKAGAVAVVHYGEPQFQEVWVKSGTNDGNWYPLGGEFGPLMLGPVPQHPVWSDILERGPVTVLVGAQYEVYQAGWTSGRARLVNQFETLCHEEGWAPPHE